MSLSAPAPPLLLTKRLTSFLRTNLSPQIHTALLTTLSGKLLSHASSQPVSTLRTQSTVAASIWAIYSSSSTASATEALPDAAIPSPSSHHRGAMTTGTPSRNENSNSHSTSGITVQLARGVLVVRKLRCGLLFVCMGPAPDGTEPSQQQGHEQSDPVQTPQQVAAATAAGGEALHHQHQSPLPGSPLEVGSVGSTGAQTIASVATTASVGATGVVMMRRQAEELARWLDDKLGSLGIPEEGWS